MNYNYIYIFFFCLLSVSLSAQSDTILHKDPFDELYIVASDSAGCIPMKVTFDASLTGDIRFIWDFGDGENSNLATPKHTYLNAGIYTVTLKAYYGNDSIQIIKQDWISAYPVVFPNFNTAQKCVCHLPTQITFLNNSNSSAKYKWVFEGSETPDFEGYNPPPITYNDAGKYQVSLIAITEHGCSDTLSIEKYLNIGHKVAFTADKTMASCAPLPVSFTDKSTGCPTKWKWDFGDGTPPSFSRDPVHIYSKMGDYTVRLYVNYEGDCIDSLVQKNMISIGGPKASLQVEPTEVCENEPVNFKFSASGYMFLEFAPGDIKLLKGLRNEETNYTHHFRTAGMFLPSYTVIDSSGCLNKFFVNDSIRVLPRPNTDFTTSASFGKKPLNFSLLPNNEGFEYKWTVLGKKDTLESTEKKPAFTLENAGRYSVQMIAFHANGCSDTLLKKEFIAILDEGEKNIFSPVPISATVVPVNDGSDDLNITINSVEKNAFSIAIINETGAVISAQMLSVQGLKSTKIKTLELAAGTYNIVIKTKEGKEILQQTFGKK